MMFNCRTRRSLFLAALIAPGLAWAEPESCRPEPVGIAYTDGAEANAARLQCDIDRAVEISRRSEQFHGPRKASAISIVDTASPSGAAYVYDVYPVADEMMLEARSVPVAGARSRAPACKLTTILPKPLAQELETKLAPAALTGVPEYGLREQVTLNPDGSRNVRLLLDSHDVVTTISTSGIARHFSRHAESTDEIASLNGRVIGIANFSSGWSCNRP